MSWKMGPVMSSITGVEKTLPMHGAQQASTMRTASVFINTEADDRITSTLFAFVAALAARVFAQFVTAAGLRTRTISPCSVVSCEAII
jgi:hypothetical protein